MAKCFKCGRKADGPCQWCGKLVCWDCATSVEKVRIPHLFRDDEVWYEYYCSGRCKHMKEQSERGEGGDDESDADSEDDDDEEQDEDADEEEPDDDEEEDREE